MNQNELNIAVIGAQGHFGSKLFSRLKKLYQNVHGTETHEDTERLIPNADVVIITVKPRDVLNLVHSIKHLLKRDAVIISFCAGVTAESIHAASERIVIRGMADPLWSMAAYLSPTSLDADVQDFCFSLCDKTLSYNNDAQIDEFTYNLSYIYVVLLMKLGLEIDNSRKTALLREVETKMNLTTEFVDALQSKIESYGITLKDIMTPGGVSEGIYRKLKDT